MNGSMSFDQASRPTRGLAELRLIDDSRHALAQVKEQETRAHRRRRREVLQRRLEERRNALRDGRA